MQSTELRPWLELSTAEKQTALGELRQPKFRAGQIDRWIYQANVLDFAEMTDLPASLRESLANTFVISPLTTTAIQESSDGWTRKSLFAISQGKARPSQLGRLSVESVLMRYDPTDSQKGRLTVCVSSQAGCAAGCVFCATGQAGFVRHLTTGEIVAQVLHHAAEVRQQGDRITNIVLMGQGEPMLNIEAVWAAIERLNDPSGLNIGARHITISTVGIVPGIVDVADRKPAVRLAVSLHAPNNELRSQLVPINKKYPLHDILDACSEYAAKTGRRITFEYALMGGINDHPELAFELAQRIRHIPSHVNLIPLNPTPGSSFTRPSSRATNLFRDILNNAGIPATVRIERGIDIFAGCGQLRAAEAKRVALQV